MSNEKQGYAVEVVVNCYNEKGEKISSTDSDWFGFSRAVANAATMSLLDGVKATVKGWEDAISEPGSQRR